MERKLSVTEAREKFSELVEQVQYQGDTILISRHGKPAAAVVPIEIYTTWKRQRRLLLDAIRKIQEVNKDIDPNQVWEDVLQAQQATRSS